MNNQQPANPSPITQLPDGSGCFTATIMSREEAMKLPLKDRPLCYRISSDMYRAVFEAIGAASMCWQPRPGTEVFKAEEASNIAVALCFQIAGEIEGAVEARLAIIQLKADQLETRLNEIINHPPQTPPA
jgi:hypothetical protein